MTADELEMLERSRLRSLVDGDIETAARLHADDYQLITPGGVAITKAAYLELVASDDFTYVAFDAVSPVAVRLHDDVAIARYQARIEVRDATGEVEAAIFWHTDVWERQSGGWRAVWSHATRARPSGRATQRRGRGRMTIRLPTRSTSTATPSHRFLSVEAAG